jgi:hypothetical protein
MDERQDDRQDFNREAGDRVCLGRGLNVLTRRVGMDIAARQQLAPQSHMCIQSRDARHPKE